MFALKESVPAHAQHEPFGIQTFKSYTKYGGFIAWGEFTLSNFYGENLAYRNTWSRSNCDFDMARYRGTKLTFFPHADLDYIVHYDTDYGDAFKIEKKMCHPALLLNMPNSKLVLSVKTRGFWKTVTIFMPRPSIYHSGWDFQNKWADRGLGMWAVAGIELQWPWTNRVALTYDPKTGEKEGESVRWWENTEQTGRGMIPSWLAGYWFYLDNTGDDGEMKKPTDHPKDWLRARNGPLVIKDFGTSFNVLATYHSYWQWGGDWGRPAKVCDPADTSDPHPTSSNPREVLSPDDLDKWGIITAKGLKRLIGGGADRARKRRRTPFCEFQSTASEEETELSDSDAWQPLEEDRAMETDEEGGEGSCPEMDRRTGRVQHRSRGAVERLIRVLSKMAGQRK